MRCVPVYKIRVLCGAAQLFRCFLYNPVCPRQNMLWTLQSHKLDKKIARKFSLAVNAQIELL